MWEIFITMEQTLFLQDRPLCTFSINEKENFTIKKIHESDFNYWPFILQMNHSPQYLKEWLGNRITQTGRKLLKRIREARKARGSLGALSLTKGLSLNDCYWVGNEGESFSDVNLYDNPFSEEIAELAFFPEEKKAAEFALRSPEYSSYGAMRKCWIRRDNILFLMKSDDWPNTDGYNQSIAEYFACQVANAFGIAYVPYSLEKRVNSAGKEEIVSLCQIFTSIEKSYVPARIFFLYKGIEEADLLPTWLEIPSNLVKLLEQFDAEFYEDMMIFDSLIGNQDRHLFNFGYYFDSTTNKLLYPAPVYDNGLSLLAGLANREKYTIDDCLLLNDRGAYLLFDDQCLYFLRERHFDKILAVANIDIGQDKDIRIEDATLEKINTYLHIRARYALQMCETKFSK